MQYSENLRSFVVFSMKNSNENLAQTKRDTAKIKQQEEKKKALKFMFIGAGIIILAVAQWGFGAYQNRAEEIKEEQAMAGEKFADIGRSHIDDKEIGIYNSIPPTSGDHYSLQTNWGMHTESIPEEYQLHNLEHGGVLMQYDPNLPEEFINSLEAIGERYQWRKIILAPFPPLEDKAALTAWNYLDLLGEFDEERILNFIEVHRNRGPENVPDDMRSAELP